MALNDEELDEMRDWWRDVIYKEDGTLKEDAVLAELWDFLMICREVPQVYEAITGGAMSKPNYYAKDVLAAHEQQLELLITDARREVAEEVLDMVESNLSREEILKEYPDPWKT